MSDAERAMQRWLKAQSAEKDFWREHIQDTTQKDEWPNIIRHGFGLDMNFFSEKNILEIGCGPNGIIFYLDQAKTRIGVEPMIMSELEEWKKPYVKQGVKGEDLPFEDKYFDVIICFNALDHCIDPSKVMLECHRVLKSDGKMLLWIHGLRNQYKIFQGLLNKLDPPHPHHFTSNEILRINKERFFIEKEKIIEGMGFYGYAKAKTVKIWVANMMTETIWLLLKK